MKNLTLILVLLLPVGLYAQSDTQQICISETVTLNIDTTWNHHIMESDLILYVEVTKVFFITTAGYFSGNVLQVVKGEYNDQKFGTNVSFIDFSVKALQKRTAAICPSTEVKLPYKCFIGLNRIKGNYGDMKDPITKQWYKFFISEKDMNSELKNYLFKRFLPKKLLPIYFRLTGN